MDAMEDEAPAAPLSASLYPDALEDSYAAAYCLLVVAPASTLAARWLLSRGQRTTPREVALVSLLVPLALVGLPALLQWWWSEPNVYKLLQMSRIESHYVWAQKYAFWRSLFQKGEMPAHIWQQIDQAYDHIYNDKARLLYDVWGPVQADMSPRETLANTGLFYLLWTFIICALTSPKAAEAGSKWAYSGMVAVSVKLLRYDPPIKSIFKFTTPREFVMWGHRLLPIFVFASVSIKRVFFIDLDAHHQKVLRLLAKKNQQIMQELHDAEKALFPDEEETEEQVQDDQ